jgi:PleD family two-component response regulator
MEPDSEKPLPSRAKTAEEIADEDAPAAEFGRQFPAQLAALRVANQALARSTTEPGRAALLADLSAKVHGLVGGATVAGMGSFARVADALEALLKEMHTRPQTVSVSTLRTTANAIDFLEVLFKNGKALDAKKTFAAEILVVDDELLSRRAVTHALEKARLHATDIEDPVAALKLVSENTYDLIVLDVDMPGMNGFELCAKLRGQSLNKKTPVIFVTALNDFDARANSTMAGANDFIAKPFLFIELALKALIFICRARLSAARF